MSGLSNTDRLALSEALSQAYAVEPVANLALAVARIIADFTRSELTVVGHRHPDQSHSVTWLPEDVDLLRHDEAYEALVDTHPVRGRFRSTGVTGPIRLSDCTSDASFRASGLYVDYFRHFGVTRLAAVYVPLGPDSHVSLGVSRGGSDFTQRDLAGLAFVRPHLAAAHRRTDEVARLEALLSASGNELSRLQRGVVLLDRDGRFLHWTESAAALWREHVGSDPRRGQGLPPRLAAELERHGSSVLLERPEGSLRIERRGALGREHLVVSAVEARHAPGIWQVPGLSRRESEVLHWIGEGKANREIGVILGLAPATVRKHVEHIFQKIGVENRSSATRWLLDARRE
jgi:DNA-binding CsgD family transcriptional regulator